MYKGHPAKNACYYKVIVNYVDDDNATLLLNTQELTKFLQNVRTGGKINCVLILPGQYLNRKFDVKSGNVVGSARGDNP